MNEADDQDDLMQIDVSAAPVYGRSGAQRIAFERAAKATIEAGYDKFDVVNNAGWNEQTSSAFTSGSYNASVNPISGYATGNYGSGFDTFRHPESTLVIHMYHYHDKGAAKAVDARQFLATR